MKLLIIRHGDPDYAIDGLTEKGRREAEALSHRLVKEGITAAYCSPHGRARLTAEPTLKKLRIKAEICDWLREFSYASLSVPYESEPTIPWDLLPSYAATVPSLFENPGWRNADIIKNSDYIALYEAVCLGLDRTIEKHGYRKNGIFYDVLSRNHDTVALFCHHGIGSVLISHLLNCSPFNIVQNSCLLTTSVTTFVTEERERGLAMLRMLSLGDTSHLYAAYEPLSFMARFCECFGDDERH